jgi:hypothetical protein
MYSIFHKKIMLKPPYIYIYARLHGSGSRGRDYGCRFGSSRSRGCTGAHKLNHGPVRVVACGITEVRQKCTCVSQETLLRDKIAICGNIDHCYNKVQSQYTIFSHGTLPLHKGVWFFDHWERQFFDSRWSKQATKMPWLVEKESSEQNMKGKHSNKTDLRRKRWLLH